MNYELDISIDPPDMEIDADRLHSVLVQVLQIECVTDAVLSITIVDNATIHRINRDHLQHDYPTDVISFGLDWSHPNRLAPGCGLSRRSHSARIEGEIIVSAEYARASAGQYDWDVQSEVTLYAVHGLLHVCGYDDLDSTEQAIMRSREYAILTACGLAISSAHQSAMPGGL